MALTAPSIYSEVIEAPPVFVSDACCQRTRFVKSGRLTTAIGYYQNIHNVMSSWRVFRSSNQDMLWNSHHLSHQLDF